MKKLALALMCLVSVAFFASCDPKEGQPTIQVLDQEGYVWDGQTVDLDEEVSFGFVVASSPITNSKLASLVVKVDDTEWDNVDLTGKTEYTFTDVVTYTAEKGEIIGTSVITAVVTDAAGQTATASITLNINKTDTPILGRAFSWKKEGGNNVDGAEMAEYGLLWGNNYKEVFTTLQPLNNNVKMYLCDGDDFDDIETVEAKNAYFTNLIETGGEAIERYRKITCNNSADYNDMLAIVNGDNLHLIRISHATIEPVYNSDGSYLRTDITITGDLK